VWDHQRRHANTCNGGFSFAVQELFDRGSVSGWFKLLPFADGRTRYQVHKDELTSMPAPLLSPDPTPPASASASSATGASSTPEVKRATRKGKKLPTPTVKAGGSLKEPPKPDAKQDDASEKSATLNRADQEKSGSTLTRHDSDESISSIMSTAVTSSAAVQGELHLYLFYEDVGASGGKGVCVALLYAPCSWPCSSRS
jgi:hypothetical protein